MTNDKLLRQAALSRRGFLGAAGATGLALAGATALPDLTRVAAAAGSSQMNDANLRIAIVGDPPTVDWHYSTATLTLLCCWHVQDTLVALDADYKPAPSLADSWEVSSDGLTYTFALRKGIKWHNGKDFVADDVIASLKRWGGIAPTAGPLFKRVDSIDKRDNSTVVIKLKQKYGSLLSLLCYLGQAAVIMPAEEAERLGKERVTHPIGTGPYKFVEWAPNQHIKFVRYDDYKPRSEPTSGLAGAKIPYAKEASYVIQPDLNARLNAVLTGDIDFAMNLSADQFDLVKDRSDVRYAYLKPYSMPCVVFNSKQAPCDSVKFRQAVAAIFNCEAIMDALGPQEFWRLNNSWMPFSPFNTEAGKQYYNQNNPAKARDLLKEAGYNGQELTYLSTRQYDIIDKPAQVASQQMREAGMNVNLEIVDWATLVSRRGQEAGWHFFTTGWGQPNDPSLYPFLSCAAKWPGFYCNPKTDDLLDKFQEETTFEAQYKIWEQIHAQFWEDCNIVKFGDYFGLYAMRPNVEWDGFLDAHIPSIKKS